MKKKILIMYATYGTGHKSIANYIRDYFSENGKYEIMSIDILDYANKFLGTFTDKFYNFTMYHMPALWDLIYYSTDNKIAGKVGAEFQARVVNNKKLKKAVLDFNPDIVITTFYTAATYISKLKKNKELDCSLVSIVTDYKAHRVWLDSYEFIDALIVGSQEEKRSLAKLGMNPRYIKTFGIPVSSKYTMHLYDKSALMKKFNLTGERPIILFYGGGGNGSTVTLPYLLDIIEQRIDADIFFVCGKSQELKTKAEGIVKRHGCKNIKVLGFITNGPEYMMVSDFVITKPGGITVTECLCFKKPMVLIKGAGGQEKANYKFLTKKGYAINTPWLYKFRYTIKKMCTNPNIINNMNKNLEKLNQEEAMKKLYNLVEDILNAQKPNAR